MTKKLSLFQLPYIALYKILDDVDLDTILPLSLCSKRAKLAMKNYNGPSKNVNIDFNISQNALKVDNTLLILARFVPKLPTHLGKVTIGGYGVPVEIRHGILNTYWTDKKEGMATIIKYTLDVFNQKLHSVIAYDPVTTADVKFWMEWIKKFQGKIHKILISFHQNYKERFMSYILDSDIVTGDIEQLPYHYGSSGDLWRPRPISLNYLKLVESDWVTLDCLLVMDIKRIHLERSVLSPQDINIFLKKWVDEECSGRIKELFVEIRKSVEIDFGGLLKNIEVTRRDPDLRRNYVRYKGIEQIFGGFDIRRKTDGAMATVIAYHQLRSVTVVFWPDNEGNPYH